MTRRQTLLLIVLLGLGCAPAVTAQGSSLLYEYAIVRTTNPPDRNVLDAATWLKEVRAGKHQVLAAGSVNSQVGKEAYGMLGRMIPMTHYDPRAEAPQVQYVEEGFKFDCKTRPAANGAFRVDVEVQQSQLVRTGQNLEESDLFRVEASTFLKRGQTAIVGSCNGALTSKFLGSSYPNAPLGEDATVLFTVTLR